MAKRKGNVNKSETVRQQLRQNPDMSAKDVVATLGKKGIKVAPTFVYSIKSTMKTKKASLKNGQAAKPKAATDAGRKLVSPNPADAVLKVKHLAEELGGIANLKLLVDALVA